MWKLIGTGSQHGTSPAGRVGDVASKPLTCAGIAAVVALTGRRGRRAVARGLVCSATASLIHLPIKHVVRRSRPRGARSIGGPGPLTTSFPSGHTASDLAFLFGASQELPLLLVPGVVATACSHWSLIRTRKHYPSDVIGGGAIAVLVTAAAWKLHPPLGRHPDLPQRSPADSGPRAGRHPVARAAMRRITNQLLNCLTRSLLERDVWPRTRARRQRAARPAILNGHRAWLVDVDR